MAWIFKSCEKCGLGALFVLVTVYCLIFRALTLIGISATGIVAVTVYCTLIAAGQAILFEGRRPRDASIVVGTVALPAMVLLNCFRCSSPLDCLSWVSAAAFWLLFAPVLGYLVGIFLAGGFLLFTKPTAERSKAPETSATMADANPLAATDSNGNVADVADGRVSIKRLIRHSSAKPFAFASFVFVWVACLFSFILMLETPAISKLSAIQQVLLIAGIGLSAAFLTAVCQFRWTSGWMLIAAVLAGNVLHRKFMTLHVAQSINETFSRNSIVAAALLFTIAVFAGFGWIQVLCKKRKRNPVRMQFVYLEASTLLIVASGGLWLWLDRCSQSPAELAIQHAARKGVNFDYSVGGNGLTVLPPRIEWITATEARDFSAADLAAIVKNCDTRSVQGIQLKGMKNIAPPLVQFVEQRGMWNIELLDADFPPDLFEDIHIRTLALNLSRSTADDSTLASLAPRPDKPNSIRWLAMADTAISDQGLKYLATQRSLEKIDFSGCQITGAGFEALIAEIEAQETPNDGRRGSAVSNAEFSRTALDDRGAELLLKALPRLQELRLHETNVTEVGLRAICRGKYIQFVSITPAQFREGLIDELKQEYPDIDFSKD